MNIEKYQQYADSKLKADKMRKEIKETLDNYQTAQIMGYEAAKVKFKPLLEAQAAQTEAQEAQAAAQTAMMRQIVPFKKTEVAEKSSGDIREFVKKLGFPLPSLLLEHGQQAYKKGEEEAALWKEGMVHLSTELTRLIEETDDPTIKNSAIKYKERLQRIAELVSQKSVTTIKKVQSTTPAVSEKDQEAAIILYDNPLEIQTLDFLEETGHKLPSQLWVEGEQAYNTGNFRQWKKKYFY